MTLTAEGARPTLVLDTARPKQNNALADTLRMLASAIGRSPAPLMGDFVKVSFGPGKLTSTNM